MFYQQFAVLRLEAADVLLHKQMKNTEEDKGHEGHITLHQTKKQKTFVQLKQLQQRPVTEC